MSQTMRLNLWKFLIAFSFLLISTKVAQNAWISMSNMAITPVTPWMSNVSPPAISIINELLAAGANLAAYDPIAVVNARQVLPSHQVTIHSTLRDALRGADAIVLATRWADFNSVPELLSEINPDAVFVDGRRMLDKRHFAKYEGVGS